MCFVYLLATEDGKNTYIGATVNLDRRLRQHNGELVGGAHATHIQTAKGKIWRRVAYVSGFPDWTAALQFEWRWKQLSRICLKTSSKNPTKTTGKKTDNGKPLERRFDALEKLFSLERPTTKSIPYREWPDCPPRITIETQQGLVAAKL